MSCAQRAAVAPVRSGAKSRQLRGPGASDGGLLDREEVTWIAEAVNRLPKQEQEALAVAFYGQRTYREAAMVLGLPEGTTKARIRSGLHRLALALADPSIDVPAPVGVS